MDSIKSEQQLQQESEALELAALNERLQLTYEQRIESHENARSLMEDLKNLGKNLRAKSQRTS
jgi:hypothetical protein